VDDVRVKGQHHLHLHIRGQSSQVQQGFGHGKGPTSASAVSGWPSPASGTIYSAESRAEPASSGTRRFYDRIIFNDLPHTASGIARVLSLRSKSGRARWFIWTPPIAGPELACAARCRFDYCHKSLFIAERWIMGG
jgi:hypothetical protein